MSGKLPPSAPKDPAALVEYYAADRSAPLVISTLIFQAVAFLVVLLRFVSRYLARARFWYDDFLIVLALLLGVNSTVWVVLGSKYGFGHHTNTLPQYAVPLAKLRYSFSITFPATIALTKLSVLLMYSRLFPVSPLWGSTSKKMTGYSIAWYVLVVLNICWGILYVCLAAFNCLPIGPSIGQPPDPSNPQRCINGDARLQSMCALAIALDVGILSLPIRKIWKLRLDLMQKLSLTCIFLLGGFIIVATAVRWKLTVDVGDATKTTDPSWDAVEAYEWTAYEVLIAIIGACLPVLRPVTRMCGWRGRRPLTEEESSAQSASSAQRQGRVGSRARMAAILTGKPIPQKKRVDNSSSGSSTDHTAVPSIADGVEKHSLGKNDLESQRSETTMHDQDDHHSNSSTPSKVAPRKLEEPMPTGFPSLPGHTTKSTKTPTHSTTRPEGTTSAKEESNTPAPSAGMRQATASLENRRSLMNARSGMEDQIQERYP